jgi:hypothetical protein
MLSYAPGGLRLRPVRLILGQQGSLPPTPPPLPPIAPATILSPGAPVAEAISKVAGMGMAVGVGVLAVSAGTTWVGIHTGIKEKGFLSFTGWTVGILAGLGGILTLTTIAGLGVIKSAASEVAKTKTA